MIQRLAVHNHKKTSKTRVSLLAKISTFLLKVSQNILTIMKVKCTLKIIINSIFLEIFIITGKTFVMFSIKLETLTAYTMRLRVL